MSPSSECRWPQLPWFLSSGDDALAWARENVDDFFETEESADWAEQYAWYAYSAYRRGTVEIYRMILVPSVAHVRWDWLGKSWSAEKSGAGVYNQTGDGYELLLGGHVAPEYIDWVFGFDGFIQYGPDQWEISLCPHAPVLITMVNNESLHTPIEGSSGGAGESWSQPPRKSRKRHRTGSLLG